MQLTLLKSESVFFFLGRGGYLNNEEFYIGIHFFFFSCFYLKKCLLFEVQIYIYITSHLLETASNVGDSKRKVISSNYGYIWCFCLDFPGSKPLKSAACNLSQFILWRCPFYSNLTCSWKKTDSEVNRLFMLPTGIFFLVYCTFLLCFAKYLIF